MESQTLWSFIAATLGCALAEQDRRVVLVTADGWHQLKTQEIGVIGFIGNSPLVMVLNNGLYGVEVLIVRLGIFITTFLSGVLRTSPKHWCVRDGGAARLSY